MSEDTTIQITDKQREFLRNGVPGHSAKDSLQELIDDYSKTVGDVENARLTDEQRNEVRKIALDVVNERVVREALE